MASDGRPYAFRSFRLQGAATNVEAFLTGAAPADVRPSAVPDRHDQMPLHASVLDLG